MSAPSPALGVIILVLFSQKIKEMEARGCRDPHAQAFVSPAAMKADRKRLKAEKTDLVSQMQQLYATLESREEQLRDFIRNYEQHRKVSCGSPAPWSRGTGGLAAA